MRLVIKKTIVALLIFLVIPLITLAINWHWQPQSLNNTSQYLFWITETASFPWAVLTSVVFFILFCLFLPTKSRKNIFLLWIILVFAILFGQVVKSITKSSVAQSRPYVLWFEQEYQVDDSLFYLLSKKAKKAVLDEKLVNNSAIPSWLRYHWKNETGYSFPSGHALFASTWAFLALLILGFNRHRLIVSAFILWAILIDISRLALGMHYPVDLIGGILLAWITVFISYFFAKKWQILE